MPGLVWTDEFKDRLNVSDEIREKLCRFESSNHVRADVEVQKSWEKTSGHPRNTSKLS